MSSIRQRSGQRIIQTVQRGGMPLVVSVNMGNAVREGALAAGRQINDLFTRQLYKSLDMRLIPDQQLKAANMELAERSQAAMVRGWKAELPAKAPAYRRGPSKTHRLSQLLGPALANPNMVQATTARTISFLNVSYLNREALHWYRVNYGAFGPKVSPRRPQAFPVTVDGHTLFHLEDEHRPAANSWLPRRFTSAGTEYFKPLLGPADVHGGGTRSAVFTDLGFRALARNYDPVYHNMFLSYVKQHGVKANLRAGGVRIRSTPGRPLAVTG